MNYVCSRWMFLTLFQNVFFNFKYFFENFDSISSIGIFPGFDNPHNSFVFFRNLFFNFLKRVPLLLQILTSDMKSKWNNVKQIAPIALTIFFQRIVQTFFICQILMPINMITNFINIFFILLYICTFLFYVFSDRGLRIYVCLFIWLSCLWA